MSNSPWSCYAVIAVLLCGSASAVPAALLVEDFSANPAQQGWSTFGDSTLFRWDASSGNVSVTWDSSHTNSFLSRPLGTILTQADNFSFSFDIRLRDIQAGATPGKSNEFEIAVGLINTVTATNVNAFRGAGQSAAYGVRNVVEFDYFPDAGFGDTFATTVISTNNRIFPAHNFPLPLSTGDTFRITCRYTASDHILRTQATRNGAPYGLPPDNSLADVLLAGTPDFRVDAFAITSYNDAVQSGPLAVHGSVLAHGTVDNIELELPAAPVQGLVLRQTRPAVQIQFAANTNWVYRLERSLNLRDWAPASDSVAGQPITLLSDPLPDPTLGCYRVRAERP